MFEIKFRGKSKLRRRWVIGDMFFCNRDSNQPRVHFLFDYEEERFVGVDPDTVGAYLGVQDRNDRDIYESDVLDEGEGSRRHWLAIITPAFIGFVRNNATTPFEGIKTFADFGIPTPLRIIGNVIDDEQLRAEMQATYQAVSTFGTPRRRKGK